MARCKEFDRDDVVDKAMQVFWQKGFEATSVQDLVDAMGINRGSIYDTFGDKAGLFDTVIKRYLSGSASHSLIDGAENSDPRATIEGFFQTLTGRCGGPDGRRGCLMTNTLTELCSRDQAMAKRLGGGMLRLEDALCTLIRRGQEAGDFTTEGDARALARTLVALSQGLLVIAKVGPGPEALDDIATTALSLLD